MNISALLYFKEHLCNIYIHPMDLKQTAFVGSSGSQYHRSSFESKTKREEIKDPLGDSR